MPACDTAEAQAIGPETASSKAKQDRGKAASWLRPFPFTTGSAQLLAVTHVWDEPLHSGRGQTGKDG